MGSRAGLGSGQGRAGEGGWLWVLRESRPSQLGLCLEPLLFPTPTHTPVQAMLSGYASSPQANGYVAHFMIGDTERLSHTGHRAEVGPQPRC